MSDDIPAKREHVLETIEELICQLETIAEPDRLGYIRSNLYKAESHLLDDAEFNYNVRIGLNQIRSFSGDVTDPEQLEDITERARALEQRLPDEAELPPPDELSRTR